MNYLLQRRQRIDDVDDKDIGSKDDEVHQQADAHEVAETVATGTIDQHVGRRTDRCGEAGADADHQGDEERIRLVAQFLGSLVHDGEEHGACRRVGDELGDEGAHETDGRHDDDGIGATDIEDAEGEALGNARLLDGDA